MTDASSTPPPTVEYPDELKTKAREFFKKGAETAYSLNYDYAIEMYLTGISYWPDALEEGHQKLREIALRREASGGKKAGWREGSKYEKGGKHPRDAMLKAEYHLSKEPHNAKHMADMAKAAVEGHFTVTAHWICDLMLVELRQTEKPNAALCVLLKDLYIKLEDFVKAFNACQLAVQAKPKDGPLQDELRNLSAQATMQQGKYDGAEDFRESIRDADGQKKLHTQEQLIRSDDVKESLVAQARAEYEAEPTVAGKIYKLVDALSDTDKSEYESEAIAILEKAHKQTQQFRFRQRRNEIAIKRQRRAERRARAQYKKSPDDAEAKKQYKEASQQFLQAELDHFKECVDNYPTDLNFKHEYGKRLLLARRYDDAIPMFQEARSDPRHRVSSLNSIGQCFYYKGWFPDAIDSFNTALEALENTEGAVARELRYNLGRAFEADKKVEEALAEYRRVAQLDFNYRDVRDRIEALRKQQS